MTTAIVTMPDGRRARITGPDRTAVMAQIMALQQPAAEASPFAGLTPEQRGELAAGRLGAPPPLQVAGNVGLGALQAAGDIPAGLEQIVARGARFAGLPAGVSEPSEQRIADFEAAKRAVLARTGAGAGYIGGQIGTAFLPGAGVAASAGRIAQVAKPLAVGAALTAARPHETEAARAKEILESAAFGGTAMAGMAGLGVVAKGVKRAITGGEVVEATGQRASRARAAQDRGYTLTLGEVSGNKRIQALEDASENMLGGTALSRIRAANKENTNRILSKRIGEETPEITSEWLGKTAGDIGSEFNAVRALDSPDIVPEFKPGFKILYRGGTGTGAGRWYTDDVEHARRFGRVHAIEVPNEIAIKSRDKARAQVSAHYYLPEGYSPKRYVLDPPTISMTGGVQRSLEKAAQTGKLAGAKKIGSVIKEFKARYPKEMTWNEYADLRSEWAKTVVTSKDPDFGRRLGSLIGALDDAAAKAAPDAAPLKAATSKYREYLAIRNSVDENGDLASGKLIKEVMKLRKGAFWQVKDGEDEIVDVARTLGTFKNQVPSSGTAERQQAMKTLEAMKTLPGKLTRLGLTGTGFALGDITGAAGGYAAPYLAQRVLMSDALRKYLETQAPRTRTLARTKKAERLSRAIRASAILGGQ